MTSDDYILAGLVSNTSGLKETSKALSENIKAFLLSGGTDRLEEEWYKKVAEIACKYFQSTEEHLDLDTLSSILISKALPEEQLTQALFIFSKAAETVVTQAKFRWWLTHTTEQDNAIALATTLDKASKILDGSVQDDDGVSYQGFRDAALYLQEELGRLSAKSTLAVQPSGNIRAESIQILEEVDKAERGVEHSGRIKVGFNFIDTSTHGFDLTDFLLVGAHTGEGKSQMCANMAHNISTSGFNIQIITAETARAKYRRRLLCRHTHQPGVGVVGGIPYNNIKNGAWKNEEERRKFVDVVEDFTTNQTYGIIDVTQVSAGATIEDIYANAYNFQRAYNCQLHVQVVDYLALLKSRRNRKDRREEINDILTGYKEFCLTFDNGQGVFGIAAHQTKQDVRERVKPEPGKFYSVRDYSDTSEAGKSIDVGVMLFRDEELTKLHEVACGMVKNRDGECPTEIFRLFENYAAAYLGNLATS